ncbi:MAG: DUF1054 family protein [Aerococcaceae bacterium]|nr:DUF1054 family protein [Aerococcaceae bacterium]
MEQVFSDKIFSLFDIPTLEGRMAVIQSEVQPMFRHYGALIAERIPSEQPLPVHVAKHLRRTVYPPNVTWVGIGGDKRGYKKYAHFQLGINAEYVFVMLAIIDNPPSRAKMASQLLTQVSQLEQLPNTYCVIPDHTRETFLRQEAINYTDLLTQLQTCQKAEFMLGRLLPKGSEILNDSTKFTAWLQETIDTLLPYYQLLNT